MPPTKFSLDVIFKPKSIALIGASARRGSIGREIFDKLLAADFNGPVYAVNNRAPVVHSVPTFPSVLSIPGPVELAIIAVPRDAVEQIINECAQKGVRGVVVITAGFKETGSEGAALEKRIVEIVKAHGMRMVGPNCMGVICTDPEVRMDATFAPTVPRRGNLGFVSQSGALGATILEYANSLNLGVSMFASIGNKADISGNDLLEYWMDDASVSVVLMYLESFGNPRRFVQLARAVSRRKPIVIVKSGRTVAGARAVTSHTGAIAGADAAYDALFAQCGIIRANTIEEMFDVAMVLANQPLPKVGAQGGCRVAIVTNAGGPAIMATDACGAQGLPLAALSPQTQELLRRRLVPAASVKNPVDLLAAADEKDFRFALEHVLRDENVDAAIVIFVPPIVTDAEKVAQSIATVAGNFQKPVLGCFMGVKGVSTSVEELQRARIPTYAFPESAVVALAAIDRYARWRIQAPGAPVSFAVDRSAVAAIFEKVRSEKREHLSDEEAMSVLQAYGIPVAASARCRTWPEVRNAGRAIGYPVALKISSPGLIHKTEIGGVRLDLREESELRAAFDELQTKARDHHLELEQTHFLVQQMVEGGREVLIGLQSLPNFGALVAFGLGGIYVEAVKDVVLRIAPLTEADAAEMVQSIRGVNILRGVRGAPAVAFDKLIAVLLRVSQLSQDFPEIIEMDINPFMVFDKAEKCMAADARMRITGETL
jgi:acetyltransferase